MPNYLLSSIYLAKILLNKNKFTIFSDRKESTPSYTPLSSLSKVNIFIGPNNSGKSRFLRLLSSIGRYQFEPTDFDAKEWNQFQQNFFTQIKTLVQSVGITLRQTYSNY